MYNIEQVKILIQYKERQLKELKNSPTSSLIEIRKIEDELQTLKIYSVRYEIAKIIGYENDETFKNINYIGIELEDFSKMNLTQEQLDSLNQLKDKLPEYNAELFRTRLEMAKLLKLDGDKKLQAINYDGVENNDPSSMRYKLSVSDAAKFNALRNRVITLKQSNNYKNSDISTVAKEAQEQLIEKLNEMSLDDYNEKKQEDIDILFKLLDLIEGEKTFPIFNNHGFAYDVSKKYPDINIKIAPKQILEIIELLDHDEEMEKERYDSYIRLLVPNINELINEETITDETKAILDRINSSNYSLRIDLSSKIKQDTIQFDNKDIADLIAYLDSNYAKLNEERIEKLYTFISNRIISDIKDVENIDRINTLIAGVKNKDLRDRLRQSLKNVDTAIFSDQHTSSYSDMISEKIKKLESKRNEYLNKKTGIEALDIMYKTRAADIEKEIEKLKQLHQSHDDSYIINKLDEQYNSRKAHIIKIEKKIVELKKLKEDLKTEFQKRKVDSKIEKLQKNIDALKRSEIRIEGIQKMIMTPKMFIELKNGMISRHFESKAEVYSDYADDYKKMSEKERSLNGMFSGIKAAFYEFKANRYQNKSIINRTIYSILSKPGTQIQVTGSNKKKMSKEEVIALQRMNMQNVQQQQMAA